jgi:kynurenine formamidase
MKIFDLSQPVTQNVGEPVPVAIDLLSHTAGAAVLGVSHGLSAVDFPDGYAISMETVTLATHTATHIDAPLHYGPLCKGDPAKSIDLVPLDWFFGPGIVLHFDADPEKGPVTAGEMRLALETLPRAPRPGTIVLCDVGAARLWGRPEYFTHFRGITCAALELLLDRGVRVVGTDAFGMDPPFAQMLDAYRSCGDMSVLWPAHVLGRSREYCQIERLSGLDCLPRAHDFTVACFPIRLKDCGAAWTRAVAIFDDDRETGTSRPKVKPE